MPGPERRLAVAPLMVSAGPLMPVAGAGVPPLFAAAGVGLSSTVGEATMAGVAVAGPGVTVGAGVLVGKSSGVAVGAGVREGTRVGKRVAVAVGGGPATANGLGAEPQAASSDAAINRHAGSRIPVRFMGDLLRLKQRLGIRHVDRGARARERVVIIHGPPRKVKPPIAGPGCSPSARYHWPVANLARMSHCKARNAATSSGAVIIRICLSFKVLEEIDQPAPPGISGRSS